MVVFVLPLAGCTKLKKLDTKLGELLNTLNSSENSSEDNISESKNSTAEQIDSSQLSKKQKDSIDKWLKEHNLNRYGDKIDTYYSKGTPLIDEVSGERIERFYYILKNHPNILGEL